MVDPATADSFHSVPGGRVGVRSIKDSQLKVGGEFDFLLLICPVHNLDGLFDWHLQIFVAIPVNGC